MSDQYYTPPALARAIVQRLVDYGDIQQGDRCLDPCVGKGAFADAMRATGLPHLVRTIDLDPDMQADVTNDFRSVPILATGAYQLVASNPPFSLWQRFVEQSVGWLDPRGTVAFLLRIGCLGSSVKQQRSEFFRQYPVSTIDVIWPRPSFTGGSDNSEYALFRWVPEDFEGLRARRFGGGATQGFLNWTRDKKSKKEDP